VRTQKKLRSKLMGAFCPPTYMLKYVSLLYKKNGSRPSSRVILSKKGILKHSHTSILSMLFAFKKIIPMKMQR